MNLFDAVRTATSVIAFIEGGGLEADLGALELKAALAGLQSAKIASDRRAQIWSVVNHLETADVSLSDAISRHDIVTLAVRSYARDTDVGKLFLVRCIMAACYFYLKERELFERSIDRARTVMTQEQQYLGWDAIAGNVIHFFSGMAILNAFLAKGEILSQEDMKKCLDGLDAVAAEGRYG
jgi:hypothetical protein